jgi:hypothetical protein
VRVEEEDDGNRTIDAAVILARKNNKYKISLTPKENVSIGCGAHQDRLIVHKSECQGVNVSLHRSETFFSREAMLQA